MIKPVNIAEKILHVFGLNLLNNQNSIPSQHDLLKSGPSKPLNKRVVLLLTIIFVRILSNGYNIIVDIDVEIKALLNSFILITNLFFVLESPIYITRVLIKINN